MMRILFPLLIVSTLIFLPACDDTPAERERKVDNAADATGDALKKAADKTGNALEKAADSTGRAINTAVDKVQRVDVDVDVTTKPAAATAPATTRPALP